MRRAHGCGSCLAAVAAIVLALELAAPSEVPAQQASFLEKGRAISLIVPYPPGGGTDVTARLLAPMLEKELGTPVQVVNKPGAGGQVGFTEISRSKPDGYTIGYLILPTVVTTYLDPERKAVFSRKSFEFLGMQDNDVGILAVRQESPYKTMKDLIEAAKASPGKIRTTTAGILSDDHIAALMTEQVAGVKFAVVHFDGSAPGRTAVLGGHVEAYFGNQSEVVSQVRSGEMRLLAVFDSRRSKFYPDVKTAEEQGYKLYSGVYRGLAMPAGAPKEVLQLLSEAIRKVLASDEFAKRMEKLTYSVLYMEPAKYASFWTEYEAQAKRWVELSKEK